MGRKKRVLTTQPLLLSVADVAVQLGVCRQTVYHFIYHEGLPSIQVGGIRRVHPASLDHWLKEHEKYRTGAQWYDKSKQARTP